MIGIIGAMSVEINKISELLVEKRVNKVGCFNFIEGMYHEKKVVLAVCGVGKVFAAICTQAMIFTYNPNLIINTGVAGNLSDKLNIGDIAVASSLVCHDIDTSPLGDPIGMISGINIIYFECDKTAENKILQACDELKFSCQSGVIASGDQFISDSLRKKFIVENFDGIACDMEAAAIAQTCYVNNIKFAAIRSISDDADGNAPNDFISFVESSAVKSSKVISRFLEIY